MWRLYTMLKWWIGYKSRPCALCTFYEASHYNHALEFDMESYPCDRFKMSTNRPGGE